MGDVGIIKNAYLCISFFFLINIMNAQNVNECSDYVSDELCLRYTASGYQEIVGGNHSKAINESRKIANITAQSELSKMVNSAVTRVVEVMSNENDNFIEVSYDTTLISSYMIFHGMKTICRSEPKLIGNMYVTYITKEISFDNISDMMSFKNDNDKQKFRELITK